MYTRFANLSRRMHGALKDAQRAYAEYYCLADDRNKLLIKHRDDLEIGVHQVPGGHVVVQPLTKGFEVTFFEDEVGVSRIPGIQKYAKGWPS